MNKLHFFIKDNGKLFVFKGDLPEEPKYKINCAGTHACTCASLAFENGANRDIVDGYDDNCPHRYQEALQRAKKDAIEVDNQMVVHAMVLKTYNEAKVDTIYSLEGCEMKVKKTPIHPEHIGCDITDCLDFARCQDSEGCRDAFTYVALITFSEKKEDKPTPEKKTPLQCLQEYFSETPKEEIEALLRKHNLLDPTPEKEEETQEELKPYPDKDGWNFDYNLLCEIERQCTLRDEFTSLETIDATIMSLIDLGFTITRKQSLGEE